MNSSRPDVPIAILGVAVALALPALAMFLEVPAHSQGKPEVFVQSIQTPAPALGNVVSAPSGNTVFRVSPSTGEVTRVSGAGYRVSGGTTRSLVTLSCTGAPCSGKEIDVTIGSIGSPTGRALQLGNFTISPVDAVVVSGPTGSNPITFRIAPIGNGATKSFYVGADFTISGNESTNPTGAASAAFQVTADLPAPPSTDAGTGLAIATVFRPITVSENASLSFGAVSRPFTGNGLVDLDAASGTLTVAGQGVQAMPVIATPARASYTVNGEGGQVFSIYVPPSFQMAGPSGDITVTTENTAVGTQILSGTLGGPGSYSFNVGGSFPISETTPVGVYSGTYSVLVQYN